MRNPIGIVLLLVMLGVVACGAFVIRTMLSGDPPALFLVVFLGFDVLIAWIIALAVLETQRPNCLGAILALLLPVGLLAGSTAKLHVLGIPALFTDAVLLPDLRRTLATPLRCVVDSVAAGVAALFLLNLRVSSSAARAWCLLGALIVLPIAVVRVPSIGWFAADRLPLRITDFPFFGHMVNAALMALEEGALVQAAMASQAPGTAPVLDTRATMTRRDVHMVVVESFVDPLWFPAFRWPEEPLSPLFARWRTTSGSTTLVPVFGNRSSNTEFEALCGLPAMAGVSGVVFNQIGRDATLPCLPRRLAEQGFATLAVVPNAPTFFGAGRAFQAMGFARTAFASDLDMSDRDGMWLSADATLDQLDRLSTDLRRDEPARAAFTYAFINAGHFPYDRDRAQRPDLIEPAPRNTLVRDWANGAHYNALALERHVARVMARNDDAIIVILGDHNPPLGPNFQGFLEGGRISTALRDPLRAAVMYETPLIVLNRGHFVRTGRLPAWQLPDLVLDLLSDGAHCAERACGHRMQNRLRPLSDVVLEVAADSTGERSCPMAGRLPAAMPTECAAIVTSVRRLHGTLLRLLRPAGD